MNIEKLLPLAASVSKSLEREDNKCWSCDSHSLVEATEWHHIVPQHLGGPKDGPLVNLCGSCHNKVHRVAVKRSKNNNEDEVNVKQSLLVKLIVKAMFADKNNEGEIPRNIMFKVPDKTLRKMHKRKLDTGFTNLTDYIKSLIEKDINML